MNTAYRMVKIAAFMLEPGDRLAGRLHVQVSNVHIDGTLVVLRFADGSQRALNALSNVLAAQAAHE